MFNQSLVATVRSQMIAQANARYVFYTSEAAFWQGNGGFYTGTSYTKDELVGFYGWYARHALEQRRTLEAMSLYDFASKYAAQIRNLKAQ